MEKIDSKENLIRLVNEYKNLVFSICLKITGDYFIAEDITQETFINAYNHWEEFDGSNEKAWLSRIASNKSIDYLRKAARREIATEEENIPEVVSDSKANPEEIYLAKDTLQRVEEAVEKLPEPYRHVARKYYLEGIPIKDIASEENKSIKTIQTQAFRAKESLKKLIRKEDLL